MTEIVCQDHRTSFFFVRSLHAIDFFSQLVVFVHFSFSYSFVFICHSISFIHFIRFHFRFPCSIQFNFNHPMQFISCYFSFFFCFMSCHSIHPSNHPTGQSFKNLSIHQVIHWSILASSHPPSHPSTPPCFHPDVQKSSMFPSRHPKVHPFVNSITYSLVFRSMPARVVSVPGPSFSISYTFMTTSASLCTLGHVAFQQGLRFCCDGFLRSSVSSVAFSLQGSNKH